MNYSKLTIYSSMFFISLAGVAKINFASADEQSIFAHNGGGANNGNPSGGNHHGGGGHHNGGGNHETPPSAGNGHHNGGGGGYPPGNGHHDEDGDHHGGGHGHHDGDGDHHGGYSPPIVIVNPQPAPIYLPPVPVYPNPVYGCQVLNQSGEYTEACSSHAEEKIQCYAEISTQEKMWGDYCVANIADCYSDGVARVEPCIAIE